MRSCSTFGGHCFGSRFIGYFFPLGVSRDLLPKVAEDFELNSKHLGFCGDKHLKRGDYYRAESPSIGGVPRLFRQNSPRDFVSGLRQGHLGARF
jgi:hypothetical protein